MINQILFRLYEMNGCVSTACNMQSRSQRIDTSGTRQKKMDGCHLRASA